MMYDQTLARAARAFQRRDLAGAEVSCRAILAQQPRHARAMHLLGLVHRQLGDAVSAERLLRSSVGLEPLNVEFRVNFSNLLRALGRYGDAEAQLRSALAVAPDARAPRLALARVLNDGAAPRRAEAEARRLLARDAHDAEALVVLAAAQRATGRRGDAAESYRAALAARPDYAVAHHDYGALLCELERGEAALAELERAARLGAHSPQLDYNRGSALFSLGRLDEAEAALRDAVVAAPAWLDPHVLLAKLRFMRGDADFTRDLAAAAAATRDVRLTMALGDLLRRGGRLEQAEQELRRLLRTAPSPALRSSLAVVLQEQGRLEEALAHAEAAATLVPDDAAAAENLIAVLLQLGEAARALPLVARQRRRHPQDQRWLTYDATAARLAGEARAEALLDYDRFVHAFELEPPAPFGTIEDFHAELVPRLLRRHRFETHPLDQSLRHGTQTARDLRHDDDPVIAGFLAALAAPLSEYRRRIGRQNDHPFLARNRGEHRLAGCWSVRLGPGGYHVNHIHPQGWISSAYYVEVPPQTGARAGGPGWLKFGEPRMPAPGVGPEHFVRPAPGRLVLFPSYLWHGTVPFHGDAPRMTIAFDAVTPAPAP